jgi:lysozyme
MSARIRAIAALAVAIAIPAEGLRQWAYRDPPGVLTICYGHTGPDVKPGGYRTLEQCKELLDQDMASAVGAVERCHPGLPVPVAGALADAVYNIGPRIACDRSSSTMARLLDQRRFDDACRQHPRWNKSTIGGVLVELPGLTKRTRQREALCLGWRDA